MRAEFLRDQEDKEGVVAIARWTGASVEVDSGDADVVARIFRPASVSVDDPSLRSFGTSGEVTLQPGSLRWFMAVARTRGQAEGLRVRFVSEDTPALGWDPAGAYRTFVSSAERLAAAPSPRTLGSSSEGALAP